MVNRVRGKFFVLSLKTTHRGSGTQIELGAVSPSDKEKSENNIYHKYTPSASVSMFVDNPEAEAFFTLGKSLYVDFTEAPAE